MAKIDDTVFTAQIKAVNTILQLCYTLKDYVKSLIDQGNGNIDDITTINEHLVSIEDEITSLQDDITNLENNKLSMVNSTTYAIQVYGKQPDGSQKMYDASLDAMPSSVALRNTSGAINIGEPVWPSNAATKNYCDTGDLFENIKDNNGNNRFVEGSLNPSSITGITYNYSKWSLSGTHLMMVLAGFTTNSVVLSQAQTMCEIELPSYIFNKIYPVTANQVDTKQIGFKNTVGGTIDNVTIWLVKGTNKLIFENRTNITISTDRYFRMQFDLLIDNS